MIAPVEGSFRTFAGQGGGYLLETIGSSAPRSSKADILGAFSCLQQLHEVKIVHGDARLPNLIDIAPKGGEVKTPPMLRWIDLSGANLFDWPSFLEDARYDARVLSASLLNRRVDSLPASLGPALDGYDASVDKARSVALDVWRIKGGKA